jgi:hypothetical protein
MKLKEKLTKFFSSKSPKWSKETNYVIEFAFKHNGKNYYQMSDYINIPCERAFTAVSYYDELTMKCDRAFLLAHNEAIENACNNGKLTEVVKLNHDLKLRLSLVSDPDLLLKLASVVFFDDNESPLVYDFAYNEKKLKEWKKDKLMDFFQVLPLQNLIPSLDFSKIDLKTFTKMNHEVRQLTVLQIDNILLNLSPEVLKGDLASELILQKEALQNSIALEG